MSVIRVVGVPAEVVRVRLEPRAAAAGYVDAADGLAYRSEGGVRYIVAVGASGVTIAGREEVLSRQYTMHVGATETGVGAVDAILGTVGLTPGKAVSLIDSLSGALVVLNAAGWQEGDSTSESAATLSSLAKLKADFSVVSKPGEAPEDAGDEPDGEAV